MLLLYVINFCLAAIIFRVCFQFGFGCSCENKPKPKQINTKYMVLQQKFILNYLLLLLQPVVANIVSSEDVVHLQTLKCISVADGFHVPIAT